MFDDENFNNAAVDLNRVRKLAGLPETGGFDAPADTYDAEDDFELDIPTIEPMDVADVADIEPAPALLPPAISGATTLATDATLSSEPSHWSAMLSDLEAQLDSIPVGEFREVIDSLRHLANYAEDIRRTLVTEGRKTFADYVAENSLAPIKPSSTGARTPQTIGANRNDAIKSLQARMGADPATAAKKFDAMTRKGMIKNSAGKFTMDTLDDDEFTAVVNDPMLDK